MKVQDLKEGMRVRYVPMHAQGDLSHPDVEDGVITSWRVNGPDVTVFVRYATELSSKATYLHDLVQG